MELLNHKALHVLRSIFFFVSAESLSEFRSCCIEILSVVDVGGQALNHLLES